MSHAHATPYGAYELKATYQRNLLLGNLTVILLVLALLVTAWAFSGSDPGVMVSPIDRLDPKPIDWRDFQQESIVRDLSAFSGATPVAPEMSRGIPVPMPDSAIADPDVVVMSQADRAAVLDWGRETGPGEPGNFVVDPDLPEILPSPNSFIVVEKEPQLIREVSPEYPRFAEQAGLEGTVWIKALVGKTGSVLDALVYKSSGVQALDDAALEVADQCLYKPAIQSGNPVALWVVYRVDFILEE